ncbi:uncharacterized protein LOC117342281 [Pecten maximus]|uniref:uncharacterized protein LOC117342281 n=1 Tax=Pecten maximus TaxID=6579 RepID=UPI001458E8F6|nr:uncharacterized protein LOC117342281 [Pecten maximus]
MFFNKSRSAPGGNMMQNYMEKQMTSLHNSSSSSVTSYKDKVMAFLSGVIFITLLPYIHIGIIHLKIWVPGKPKVDKNKCTCSCFDTVFRGQYEDPGATTYKHVYFNATWQTMRIWLFTVIFILLAYESVKYLIPLIRRGNLRRSMFVLYVVNLYPHYYSWWSYFSYYNEDFYDYYRHHMLFTITEVIATCLVLNLCDSRNEIISWKILAIVSINLMHISVEGSDQFIQHVIYRRGSHFQNARNIGLMIPDLLHVFIPLYLLYKYAKSKEMKLSEICYKEELLMCVVFISFGTLIGRLM